MHILRSVNYTLNCLVLTAASKIPEKLKAPSVSFRNCEETMTDRFYSPFLHKVKSVIVITSQGLHSPPGGLRFVLEAREALEIQVNPQRLVLVLPETTAQI